MNKFWVFWAIHSRNHLEILKNVFSKKGHKIPMIEEAPRLKFLVSHNIFIKIFLKYIFEVGGHLIDDLGGLFQKYNVEF